MPQHFAPAVMSRPSSKLDVISFTFLKCGIYLFSKLFSSHKPVRIEGLGLMILDIRILDIRSSDNLYVRGSLKHFMDNIIIRKQAESSVFIPN